MTVLNGLYKANYKINGTTANFYARVCQEPQIGRKTVVHEYPQSDTRFVQDNGKISGIYTLQVEIQETTSSAYKRAIQKLRSALETPGIGVLTHPELGRKNVVPTQSSRNANIVSENGLSSFTLTFMESDPNKFPTATQGNIGFLGRLYDTITGQNESYFAGAFDAINSGIDAFNDARDNLQELTNFINDSVATVNGFADEIAATVADISDFQSSLTELMQTPTNLASRLTQIWNNLSTITDNFGNLFNLSLNIYGTGSAQTNIVAQSPITATINNNRTTIFNNNNAYALNLAYLASVNIEYVSQEQIDNNLKLLNDAFEALNPNAFDEDIYYNLQNMRIQNRLYLENLRLSLPYIQTIYTNSIPSSILAYNLYEDSNRSQHIVDLNKIEDPAFAAGNINVLSQ